MATSNGQTAASDAYIAALGHELIQVEHRMIPLGLHILGKAPTDTELVDMLSLVATFNPGKHPTQDVKLPTLPALIARGWVGITRPSNGRSKTIDHARTLGANRNRYARERCACLWPRRASPVRRA
jgi:cobalamin biosynthesis Mg chelatase CobN